MFLSFQKNPQEIIIVRHEVVKIVKLSNFFHFASTEVHNLFFINNIFQIDPSGIKQMVA